jgi:hypothetical protein
LESIDKGRRKCENEGTTLFKMKENWNGKDKNGEHCMALKSKRRSPLHWRRR